MSFISTLKQDELNVLRKVVKQVHFKYYPKDFCTDREADKLIDSLAPQTVEKLLKVGVDFNIDNI